MIYFLDDFEDELEEERGRNRYAAELASIRDENNDLDRAPDPASVRRRPHDGTGYTIPAGINSRPKMKRE